MTFKKWLLHFEDVRLPIGDLARDIKDDETFPSKNGHKAILDYLEQQNACDAAIITFENAWNYYLAENGPV